MRAPRIYFALWKAGLFNQLMSFEIAVGLQALLRREVIVGQSFARKGIKSSLRIKDATYATALNQRDHPQLQDLIEWPRQSLFHFLDEEIRPLSRQNAYQVNISRSFVDCHGEFCSEREPFSDGRQELHLDLSRDLVCQNTLTWYSRFFLNRTRDINEALARVAFKAPYHALAIKIAGAIGPFYGAHIRLSDFPSKIYALTQHEINQGIRILCRKSYPLVIASDEPLHPFHQNIPGPYRLLEEIIIGDFGNEFRALPFHDQSALGIISNLVMGQALDFIGTQGSTFTGYIHRQLYKQERCLWRFFSHPHGFPPHHGTVSWSEMAPQVPNRNWWREWPESRVTPSAPVLSVAVDPILPVAKGVPTTL